MFLDKKELSKMYYQGYELGVEERRSIYVGDIKINKAKCLSCEDIIQSKHRHDFVTCKCGNLSVDGGSWYLKRGFRDGGESYEDLSVMYEEQPGESLTE